MIDEAHATGVLGKEEVGYRILWVEDRVPIVMERFQKPWSLGGYVAGSRRLIDFLRTGRDLHI